MYQENAMSEKRNKQTFHHLLNVDEQKLQFSNFRISVGNVSIDWLLLVLEFIPLTLPPPLLLLSTSSFLILLVLLSSGCSASSAKKNSSTYLARKYSPMSTMDSARVVVIIAKKNNNRNVHNKKKKSRQKSERNPTHKRQTMSKITLFFVLQFFCLYSKHKRNESSAI